MGGKSNGTEPTKLNGIQVQSSSYGVPISLAWGTVRANCNIIDYVDFKAKSVSSSAGGKGGGTTSSYSYSATVLMGSVAGVVEGCRTIWRDQSIFTTGSSTALAQAGLSMMTGELGQAPWSYMTTNHSDRALGYSGLCYFYAPNYPLSSGANIPNHAFELQMAIRQAGFDDANPADIITDFLTSSIYALPQWSSTGLGDLTDYGNYCLASGLLLSPLIDSQRQASAFLTEIVLASNSNAVMSEGVLKIVPYGDTPVTGNGVTWTPDLTPIWGFTEDDILGADQSTDPVLCNIQRLADSYNSVQVEFLDRAQQYAVDLMPGRDQPSLDLNGPIPQQSSTSVHSVCDRGVATTLAQLLAQRTANVRRTYTWSTHLGFWWLDPMDLVNLSVGRYFEKLVRITKMQESSDQDGNSSIQFTAEEMLVGSGHAPEYSRQTAGGYISDFNVNPGDTNTPVIINPPRTLTGSALEMWIGASGGAAWGGCEVWMSVDGTAYVYMGDIEAAASYGELTSSLPVGSDPDTTNTPDVSLALSGGSLSSYTSSDADAFLSLCMIISGGTTDELISYETATLTGTNAYQLSYLRRGLYSTPNEAHASGDIFIRLDGSLFKLGYQTGQIGKSVSIKLASFNIYGRAVQPLDIVTSYDFTLTPSGTPLFDLTQVQGALATLDEANTLQITPNAVTTPYTASGSTSIPGPDIGNWTTLVDDTFTLAAAGQYNVWAVVFIVDGGGHDAAYHASGVRVQIDGTTIPTCDYEPTAGSATGPISVFGSVSLAAGSHEIVLAAYCKTGDSIGLRNIVGLTAVR